MRVPVVTGVIQRRLLINYRVDPAVIARVLPDRFRPKLHAGYAVAGICLIRLEHIRPRGLPSFFGVNSENAAHRIAVEWDGANGRPQAGVFVTRRDTDSRINHWLGGRVFPGKHHYADFTVTKNSASTAVSMRSRDGAVAIEATAHRTTSWPADSIFRTLQESSLFFEAGSLGYSLGRNAQRFDGLELRTRRWHVQPLEIEHVHSSFFGDESLFPPGSIEFDHALFMRDVRHEWHTAKQLCV